MLGLLAMMAVQAQPVPLRLECSLTQEGQAEPTALVITVTRRGRAVAALVDGPPMFSSTQGLAIFDGRQTRDGSIAISESRPGPRELRWDARMQGDSIQLTRRGSRIGLDPVAGQAGHYAGAWMLAPQRVGGSFFLEGASGSAQCHAN